VREKFTILIADRNRNIREFLQRELSAEGHRVRLASDGREVLKMIEVEFPDLLILDLDMPYVDGLEILGQLQQGKQLIPVVVHTLLTEYANHPAIQNTAAFMEKKGNNINGLKAMIAEVLRKNYPHRFIAAQRM